MAIERYVPGRPRFLVGEYMNINQNSPRYTVVRLDGKLNCKQGEHKEVMVLVSRHRTKATAEKAAARLRRKFVN